MEWFVFAIVALCVALIGGISLGECMHSPYADDETCVACFLLGFIITGGMEILMFWIFI